MSAKVTKICSCRACDSENLVKVLDFGETGIADDYFKSSGNEATYPLGAVLCDNCGLLQLEYVVDAQTIYDNYIYVSTSSPGLDRHFLEYAKSSTSLLNLPPSAKVLDIGCNDGMLLKHFQNLDLQVVGIEPAKPIAKALNEFGIKTYNSYLDAQVVEQVLAEQGQFELISSNNVFANVHDIKHFANCVISLLNENGIWVIETGYHHSLISNFVFDNVYHEHLSYFSVSTFKCFFEQLGLTLFHVEKLESKGGSIRVYAGKNKQLPIDSSVERYIEQEQAFGLFNQATYCDFMARIKNLKQQAHQELQSIKASGIKIIGFGASATVTTVISILGLSDCLDFLVDDNPIKKETYSPQYRLPVYSSEEMYKYPNACVVILPWRFADMFIQKNTQFLADGGTFLKIIPTIELIKSSIEYKEN